PFLILPRHARQFRSRDRPVQCPSRWQDRRRARQRSGAPLATLLLALLHAVGAAVSVALVQAARLPLQVFPLVPLFSPLSFRLSVFLLFSPALFSVLFLSPRLPQTLFLLFLLFLRRILFPLLSFRPLL